MKNYKICVYAICKNEEKFVKRWYEAIKEADYIYVVDTGSTDNTVKELKKYNINVFEKKFNPWRFDEARNYSLSILPKDADICICLDLDEIMLPNWKKNLQKVWKKDTNRLRYLYNWSLNENNKPIISFYAEKIHSRNNYTWTHPVHEILEYTDSNKEEKIIYTDSIIINHYPDNSKPRSSYLPLLELSVKEDPDDDRNMHYLGREYMYYGKYNEAIDTLIKHLKLPKSTWKDERCASMRFIARSYINLNRFDEANMWLEKAINEANYLRDPYVEMAMLKYLLQDWNKVIYYCNKALNIKHNTLSYINEPFSWNETIYDLLSIAYFYQNDVTNAIYNAQLALKINPNNERIKSNLNIFQEYNKTVD